MKKLRRLLKEDFPDVRKRDLIFWALLATLSASVGFVLAFFSFREGIDFGDGSTFFQFAHNLLHGEAIYKDFIHFRTPGSYFLQALFLHFLGDQQSSLRFALLFEAQVLYPAIFIIALGLFLKFRNILAGIIIAPMVVMLPALAQLRTALAFLAVALYIQAVRSKHRRFWLLLSGVFVGFSFTFGQEAAAMALAAIILSEIILNFKIATVKTTLQRIGFLAAGVFIGLLPLLIYVVAMSDFGTFLYYTLYYAFILQPQGMDTIYPVFSFGTMIFYIVFLFYILSFYVFYSSRKTYLPEVIFLTFVIARSITLLGRSDTPHLVFILPETIALIVYTLFRFRDELSFTIDKLKRFVPFGLALALSFYGAIHSSSFFVIVSIIIILVAFKLKTTSARERADQKQLLVVFFIISFCFGMFFHILYPQFSRTYSAMSKRGLTDTQIDGVNVNIPTLARVNKVASIIEPLKPQVIFAYPIQPFYYRFAPDHATRFMTFEPQTTETEQNQAIEDLKKTQPEVIVFDPVQAAALSGSLWKINDYVMSHYELKEAVVDKQILWIMTPRMPTLNRPLVFSLFHNNSQEDGIKDIQIPDKNIHNGMLIPAGKAVSFRIDTTERNGVLKLSVYEDENSVTEPCITINFQQSNTHSKSARLCGHDGIRSFELTDVSELTIKNEHAQSVIVNDSRITASD